MQVGDADIRIDHRQRGPLGVQRVNVRLDGGLLVVGKFAELGVQITDAIVRFHANRVQRLGVFLKNVRVKDTHAMAKNDGVGNLHHRRLQVQRKQHTPLAGISNLARHKLTQRRRAHHCRINHFARQQTEAVLKHRRLAVAFQLNAHLAGRGHHVRLFATIKIATVHVRHMCFGIG